MSVMSRRWVLLLLGIIVVIAGIFIVFPYLNPSPQPKPGPASLPNKPYEYYAIHDEKTGQVLMYVTTVQVNVGDELVTEENKKYVVVKVVQNKAYARFIEKEDLKKYLDNLTR